ncbi:hypothetical protein ACT7JT_005387, partial [Escherichia coli]
LPSNAIKDFAYIVIFLSRQTTRRQQLSRYGQCGQGVNGGSVKIWTGVWVKQAGCCYSTVVVTQWPTGVKNCQQAGMDIGGCAVSVAGRNGKECAMVKSPYGSYGIAMS